MGQDVRGGRFLFSVQAGQDKAQRDIAFVDQRPLKRKTGLLKNGRTAQPGGKYGGVLVVIDGGDRFPGGDQAAGYLPLPERINGQDPVLRFLAGAGDFRPDFNGRQGAQGFLLPDAAVLRRPAGGGSVCGARPGTITRQSVPSSRPQAFASSLSILSTTPPTNLSSRTMR